MSRLQRLIRVLEAAHRVDRQRFRRQLNLARQREDPFDMPDSQFIGTYRLSKDSVKSLVSEIAPYITDATGSLSVTAKVLITLAFYASGSYQRGVGQHFKHNVSQPTVSKVINEVTNALNNNIILSKYIKFPLRQEERAQIKQKFYELFHIPGIVGCIDGTHVCLVRPSNSDEEYFNRKHSHSLNVQIICDAELKILSVDASHGGASHDSAIWNEHPLKEYLERLNSQGETLWLLGDSGYAQRATMMVPILDAAEGSPEALYTEMHVHTRNCVERCIGVLKARWRCLLSARTLHYQPETAAKIVNACVVLHNIAREAGTPIINHQNVEDDDRHQAEELTRTESRINATQAQMDPAQRRVDPALVAGRAARAALVQRLAILMLPSDSQANTNT